MADFPPSGTEPKKTGMTVNFKHRLQSALISSGLLPRVFALLRNLFRLRANTCSLQAGWLGTGTSRRSTRLPVSATEKRAFGRWQRLAFALLFGTLLLPTVATAATPAGTIVSNTAWLEYTTVGPPTNISSNEVSFTVLAPIAPTPATIRLLQLDNTTACGLT